MDILIELLNNALNSAGLIFASIPEGVWQFLAFAAAAAAAIGAFLSARATRLASQGQLFSKLLVTYSSVNMYDSLRTIGKLYDLRDNKQLTPGFVRRMIEHRKQDNKSKQPNGNEAEEYRKIELARRRVSHFFQMAYHLFKTKETISQEFFQHICEMSGLKLFYGAVEWLEFAINNKYNRNLFSQLLEISGVTDSEREELEKLRPPIKFIEDIKDGEDEKKWFDVLKVTQSEFQADDSSQPKPSSS